MAPESNQQSKCACATEIVERESGKCLRLTARLSGVKARDLLVRPVGDKLMILKTSTGLPGHVIDTLQLPENVDPFTVVAEMTEDGCLVVEAAMMTCF